MVFFPFDMLRIYYNFSSKNKKYSNLLGFTKLFLKIFEFAIGFEAKTLFLPKIYDKRTFRQCMEN